MMKMKKITKMKIQKNVENDGHDDIIAMRKELDMRKRTKCRTLRTQEIYVHDANATIRGVSGSGGGCKAA